MGWKWVDDDDQENSGSFPPSDRGLADLNPFPLLAAVEDGSRCSTRRVVRSTCRTEEIEPGRFVRKCEKTEQTLRDCVGRPVEVLESKTELTEDDVTDEMRGGKFGSELPALEPFSFPGLRSDIEAMEHSLFGGFSHFMEAAEEMANGFFRSFGDLPRHPRESVPFGRHLPADKQPKGDSSKQEDSIYSEYSGQIQDV